MAENIGAARKLLTAEDDHLEAITTVDTYPHLFSAEEKEELDSLLKVYNPRATLSGKTRTELIQAAPQRQPEWWREMFLGVHPARRIVAEWAVRCYGLLIKDI